MPTTQTLLEQIELFQNRKMTKKEFAEKLGVAPNTITNWFNGEASPIKSFEKICEVLKLKINITEKVPEPKFTVLGNLIRHNEPPIFYIEIKPETVLNPFIFEENGNRKVFEVPDNLDIQVLLKEAKDFYLAKS